MHQDRVIEVKDERSRVFRLALLAAEETTNTVITHYLAKRKVKDGGEELVALVSKALSDRFDELKNGDGDDLLAIWRDKALAANHMTLPAASFPEQPSAR